MTYLVDRIPAFVVALGHGLIALAGGAAAGWVINGDPTHIPWSYLLFLLTLNAYNAQRREEAAR